MKTKLCTLSAICLIGVSIIGCLGLGSVTWDIGLSEIERPSDANTRYGEYTVSKVDNEGVENYYYADEMVGITWNITNTLIEFELENKTKHSIKIIWDEGAFVDTEGKSERIIHSSVKYSEKGNAQPPSIVVRGGSISEAIYPASNVYYSATLEGWRHVPLLPTEKVDKKGLKEEADGYIGKRFQVLLPLEIEDVVNEYIFTFTVEGATVK